MIDEILSIILCILISIFAILWTYAVYRFVVFVWCFVTLQDERRCK